MRTLQLFVLLLCVAIVAPATSFAAERRKGRDDDRGGGGGDTARVHAILVIGSNDKAPTDRRLARYEGNLKSSLRFASFRFAGEGSASVAGGGNANLSLPSGQTLRLSGDKPGGATVHYSGSDVFIPKGRTVVLAGRSAGEGAVYAVIVEVN